MDVIKLLDVITILSAIYGILQTVGKVRGLQEKMDALELDMRMVSAQKADISDQLEQEERRPLKKRKREVDVWMRYVESVQDQVRDLKRKVKEEPFMSRLNLENQVCALATQVDKLHERGRFDKGLTLDVQPAGVGHNLSREERGARSQEI